MKRLLASALVLGSLCSAVPATLAQGTTTPPPVTTTPPRAVKKPVIDNNCVIAALSMREDAIMATVDANAAAVKAALQARKTALIEAWKVTDAKARKAAVKKAWDDFSGTWKKAGKALNEAKKTAWSTFKDTSKKCKAEDVGETEGKDVSASQ